MSTTQGLEELRSYIEQQIRLHTADDRRDPENFDSYLKVTLNCIMSSIEIELTKARKSELSALVNHTYLNHDSSGSAIEVLKCVKERLDTLNTQLESHKEKEQ